MSKLIFEQSEAALSLEGTLPLIRRKSFIFATSLLSALVLFFSVYQSHASGNYSFMIFSTLAIVMNHRVFGFLIVHKLTSNLHGFRNIVVDIEGSVLVRFLDGSVDKIDLGRKYDSYRYNGFVVLSQSGSTLSFPEEKYAEVKPAAK